MMIHKFFSSPHFLIHPQTMKALNRNPRRVAAQNCQVSNALVRPIAQHLKMVSHMDLQRPQEALARVSTCQPRRP